MANICRNFAIQGYDTRKDCIESMITPEKTTNPEKKPSLEIKMDTGDVLALIFGIILLVSAFVFVYFAGRKMLISLNRFLAACQKTVNQLRKRATDTFWGDESREKTKKSKKPEGTKKTNIKVKSEKPKQKKGQKEKKVKIQAPNPPNTTTTAKSENEVTVTAIVEPEIPMVSKTFQ